MIALQTQEAKSATILIADDEESNRELLAHILERDGYQVLLAKDGEEAITLFSNQIDLALLDVKMPGQSGFQVCRAIKKNPETRLVPVVLITGLINTNDRIAAIDCGADDYLHKPIRREELTARVRSLLRLKQFTDELENAEGVLFSLALSIEAKDPYTEGHCTRLSKYSVELASALGLPEEDRVALRRAGIVHDIGKVAVPEHVLLKPGPLTDEERKLIEQHPIVGERICRPLRSFRLVLPVIRHHHEKLDGSGYPDGLKGDAIPMTARIMATVDVYDALTTDRPYRSAHSPEEAFAIMQKEVGKGWWDGQLVAKFRKVIGR
ncbi:MAG: HD domain-containing phosphohydrolase [Acidobacteriaceae bacterium]